MSFELRPLSLGELLDRSFSLYRRHFSTFVGIMAAPAAMMMLISIAGQMLPMLARNGAASPLTPVNIGLFFAGVFAVFGLSVLYFVVYVLATGATTAAVSDLYLDSPVTIAGSYARVRGRLGSLLLLMLLTGLRVVGAVVVTVLVITLVVLVIGRGTPILSGALAVLIGILGFLFTFFLMLRYAVSVPALTLEPVRASEALARSVELTRGRLGRVLVLVIFATVIAYISVLIFQMPLTTAAFIAGPESAAAFWLNLAAAVTGAIASAISGPIMIIAFVVFYYDVRIRHEGLDLQIMMDKLGPASATTPSGAVSA